MTSGLTTKLRKLAGIVKVPAWREALRRHRVAAGVEHAVVLRALGPLRTVVDIGANRGQFALAGGMFFRRHASSPSSRWPGRRHCGGRCLPATGRLS